MDQTEQTKEGEDAKQESDTTQPEEVATLGNQLYRIWRHHADLNGVATHGWSGMGERYRQAWEATAQKVRSLIEGANRGNEAE